MSVSLVALGLVLLALAGTIGQFPGDSIAVATVHEGIVVAAWVALWEAVATFLIRFPDDRREGHVYRRVSMAAIEVVREAAD